MDVLKYQIFTNQKTLEKRDHLIQPQVSLVIGFYNSIRFFDIVMASLEIQTFKNFEVIICDDGSRSEVVQHIHHYMKTSPLLIQHIWHEDDGWRKVEMLNKAIVNSLSDYFITIDHDCVLHPEFIHEHFLNRQENCALAGRRAELPPFLSSMITPAKIKNKFLQKNYWWMFLFMFFIKDNQWDKGIFLKNKFLRKWFNRKERSIVGCNVSFFKKDIIKLNGFDMSFKVSCGAEDTDIDCRMRNAGLDIKPMCHVAVQYHLFHPIRQSNTPLPEVFAQNRKEKTIRTKCGLDQVEPVAKIQI